MAMVKALFLRRKGFDAKVGMPEINASWFGAQADQGALKDYCNTLDIEMTNTLPVLYPHVMAGGMHMHMHSYLILSYLWYACREIR